MSGGSFGVSTPDQVATEETILRTCSIGDFVIVKPLGGGSNGLVLQVRCLKAGHPYPDKLYALKVVYNYGGLSTRGLRSRFEPEFARFQELLSKNRVHRNIVRFWHSFNDVMPEAVLSLINEDVRTQILEAKAGASGGTLKTTYGLFDCAAQNLLKFCRSLPPGVMPLGHFWRVSNDVLSGLKFLEDNSLLHRDVKLDNFLVLDDGTVCVCDLGESLKFPESGNRVIVIQSNSQGGNSVHNSPEVSNALMSVSLDPSVVTITVDYTKQAVFEMGVVLWELATGQLPHGYGYPGTFRDPPVTGPVSYTTDSLCQCSPEMFVQFACEGYPDGFILLVKHMIAVDPRDRPTLTNAISCFRMMFEGAMQRSKHIADLSEKLTEHETAAAETSLVLQQYEQQISSNSDEITQLRARIAELEGELKLDSKPIPHTGTASGGSGSGSDSFQLPTNARQGGVCVKSVTFRYCTGFMFQLTLQKTTRISELKHKIFAQSLMYGGELLPDTATVESIGCAQGIAVVITECSPLLTLNFKAVNGGITTLQVTPNETVASLLLRTNGDRLRVPGGTIDLAPNETVLSSNLLDSAFVLLFRPSPACVRPVTFQPAHGESFTAPCHPHQTIAELKLLVCASKIYCGGDELSDDVTVDAAGLFSKSVDFLEIKFTVRLEDATSGAVFYKTVCSCDTIATICEALEILGVYLVLRDGEFEDLGTTVNKSRVWSSSTVSCQTDPEKAKPLTFQLSASKASRIVDVFPHESARSLKCRLPKLFPKPTPTSAWTLMCRGVVLKDDDTFDKCVQFEIVLLL